MDRLYHIKTPTQNIDILKKNHNSSIFSQNKCTFICSSKVNKKDRFVSSFNRLHYEKHSSR